MNLQAVKNKESILTYDGLHSQASLILFVINDSNSQKDPKKQKLSDS